jgi:conjugal transfer ATP-binding protein TraC
MVGQKAKRHLKKQGFLATPWENIVQLYESMPLSQFLPYVAYDDKRQLYILADGRAAVVYEVPPLIVAGKDFLDACRSLLSEVREGAVVQFTLYASPNIHPFVNRWKEIDHPNEALRELFKRRAEFYKEYNRKPHPFTGVPFRDFRLFISIIFPPQKKKILADFVTKFKTWIGLGEFEEEAVESYQQYLDSCYDEALSLKGTIESMGFISKVQQTLPPDFFLATMREIFNPSHEILDRVSYDPDRELREQMIYADNAIILHDPETVEIDGKYLTAWTVKTYPGGIFHISQMLEVLGAILRRDKANQIKYPFLVSTAIYKLTEAEEQKIIAKLMNYKESYSPEVRQKFVKIRDQVEELEIYESIRVRNKAAAKLVRITISGFFYVDAGDLEEGKREIQNTFRTLNKLWSSAGFELQIEKFKALPTFIFSLPMCPIKETIDFLGRGKTVIISSVPNLLGTIQSDWKGTGWYKRPDYPGFIFFSRRGQVQLVSLWDSETNYNLFIAAQSGAGKSFLMNEFIANFLARGGLVYGIDVGRSYERATKIFDGQMIVFDSKLCINPFTNSVLGRLDEIEAKLGKDEALKEATAEKEQLVRLFATMAGLPATGFNEYKGILEQAIMEAWKREGSNAGVKTVRDVLREFMDDGSKADVRPMIAKMVEALYPYAEGRFAHFYNGRANVDINKPFVVLELEEVNQYESMKEVVLMSIMMILSQKIYLGDRGIPKLFFVDEAWDLLRGEHTAKFIETGYRRFRKYNTVAATITQSILDFFMEENKAVGQAIISNSEFMFLLNQRESDLMRAFEENILTVDDFAKEMLKTVMTEKGKYSEIFVKNSVTWGVMRFMVDRFSYFLYTTDPGEVAEIDRLVESGKSLKEAIEIMVERERRRAV